MELPNFDLTFTESTPSTIFYLTLFNKDQLHCKKYAEEMFWVLFLKIMQTSEA